MDYNDLIKRLKKETYWIGGSHPYSHDVHPAICDEAVAAITDLLARAEAAERERDAAVEDLRKLVPSWEFDESKED